MKKRKNLEIAVFLIAFGLSAAAGGRTVYVDGRAAGANNGSSWDDAYNYLQDALAEADISEKPVELRIAQGLYTPDRGVGFTPGDDEATFRLISGVTVRGGFSGVTGDDPDTRAVDVFQTVLAGDLSGDDKDVGDIFAGETGADNSRIVVEASNTDETAILDGVTVTAGTTCMNSVDGSPTVLNCTFTKALMGVADRHGSPRITNCLFTVIAWRAIDLSGSSCELTGCLFSGNEGTSIDDHFNSDITIRACKFIGNVSRTREVIDCHADNLRLFNCVFKDNTTTGPGLVRSNVHGEFVVDSCTFAGNVGLPIRHMGGRMVVSNCIFAGNINGWNAGIDSTSEYSIVKNCTFSDNSSAQNGSVLDFFRGAEVTNCILWGNNSPAVDDRRGNVSMTYCNVEGGWPGEGNIDVDPCFAEPGYWDRNGTPQDPNDDFWVHGDYHLRSQAGRWDRKTQAWLEDDVTSPCIDAGDPNVPIGVEPFPNGGRLNMGAYGATPVTSKSYFGRPPCDVIIAGDINGDCVVDSLDRAILESHWMMRGEDFLDKPPTVTLIEPQDGDRIAWRGPTMFHAVASDEDGQVDRVRFVAQQRREDGTRTRGFGGTLEPDGWRWEFTWPEDADFGAWTIWAEATDNEGLVGRSSKITITLYRP